MDDSSNAPFTVLVKTSSGATGNCYQQLPGALRRTQRIQPKELKADAAFDFQVPKRDEDRFALSGAVFFGYEFSTCINTSADSDDASVQLLTTKALRLIRSCEHSFALVVGNVANEQAFDAWQLELHTAATLVSDEAAIKAMASTIGDVQSSAGSARRPRLVLLHLPLDLPAGAPVPAPGTPAYFAAAAAAVTICILRLADNVSRRHRASVEGAWRRAAEVERSPQALAKVLVALPPPPASSVVHQPLQLGLLGNQDSGHGQGLRGQFGLPGPRASGNVAGQGHNGMGGQGAAGPHGLSEAQALSVLQSFGSLAGLAQALLQCKGRAQAEVEAALHGQLEAGQGSGQGCGHAEVFNSPHGSGHGGHKLMLARLEGLVASLARPGQFGTGRGSNRGQLPGSSNRDDLAVWARGLTERGLEDSMAVMYGAVAVLDRVRGAGAGHHGYAGHNNDQSHGHAGHHHDGHGHGYNGSSHHNGQEQGQAQQLMPVQAAWLVASMLQL